MSSLIEFLNVVWKGSNNFHYINKSSVKFQYKRAKKRSGDGKPFNYVIDPNKILKMGRI
jgi:hypothetical protein